MAFSTKTLLNAVSAITTGTSSEMSGAVNFVFHIQIQTTATAKIFGSMDNVTFLELSSHTASGKFATTEPWSYFRADVSAWTAGTVTVKVSN